MIEREVQVPKERPLVAEVIYNRLKAGQPARDRRDDPLRGLQNYDEQLTESRARRRDTPYNTRIHPGLPPTPIGNPGLARSRRPRTRPRATSSTSWSSPGPAASTSSSRPRRSSTQAEAEYQQALAGAGRLADRLLSVTPMPRLAVLGHPVAHSRSPAMQNAALAELGPRRRVVLRGDRGRARGLRRPGPLAARRGLRRRQRDRPAQARGAGASPTRPSAAARAIGAANTLSFDGRRDRGREHRRGRDHRARSASPSRACGRWCSAPAARRGPRSGRCATRAPRSRLEPHRGEGASRLAAEFGRRSTPATSDRATATRRPSTCRQRHDRRPGAGRRRVRRRPQT